MICHSTYLHLKDYFLHLLFIFNSLEGMICHSTMINDVSLQYELFNKDSEILIHSIIFCNNYFQITTDQTNSEGCFLKCIYLNLEHQFLLQAYVRLNQRRSLSYSTNSCLFIKINF